MIFRIDNIDCAIAARPGEKIKIYRVPQEYAEDGLFVAQWGFGEIEPAPGCLGCDAKLAVDGIICQGKDDAVEYSGYLAQGVEINA